MNALAECRRATAKSRGKLIHVNAVTNLLNAWRVPAATTCGRPLEGMSVCVVGAGPSLDKNILQLRRAADVGPVFTVNTALGALSDACVRPDVVVATENIDVSGQLNPDDYGHLVTSLTAHPNLFKMADAWVSEAAPGFMRIAELLRVDALHMGGAALTTAVALALHWGASRVVLVGADLAHDVYSGRAYATGSAWENIRAEHKPDGTVQLSGQGARKELHWSNSQAAPSDNRGQGIELASWSGDGTVVSTTTLWVQWEWLRRRGLWKQPVLVNATEGGARIPGWVNLTLEFTNEGMQVLERTPTFPWKQVLISNVERAIDDLKSQSVATLEFLENDAPKLGVVPSIPFIEGLAVGDVAAVMESDLPDLDRIRAVYEAWRSAARFLQGVLG